MMFCQNSMHAGVYVPGAQRTTDHKGPKPTFDDALMQIAFESALR